MSSSNIRNLIATALAEADEALEKGASADFQPVISEQVSDVDHKEALKLAASVQLIHANLKGIVDDRSAEEKVAEALLLMGHLKQAAEDIPVNPGLGDGVGPGAPGTAIPVEGSIYEDEKASPPQSYGDDSSRANALPETTSNTEVGPAGGATAMTTNATAGPVEATAVAVSGPPALPNIPGNTQAEPSAPGSGSEGGKMAGIDPEVYKRVLVQETLKAAEKMGKVAELRQKLGMMSPLAGGVAAGEGVPPAPTGQKGIESNEAAIALTKKDAVSGREPELNHLLVEPALTQSTDTKLQENLDHASSAGAKTAELARSYLKKVAEKGCTCKDDGTCAYCTMKKKIGGGDDDTKEASSGEPPSGVTAEEYQELRDSLFAGEEN